MRTAFFGTPDLAVPALRALARTTQLVGVVCQPDRPAGRGMKLQPPAVKTAALELGVEVHQPVKVRTGRLDEWLRERGVEAVIVFAYGRILPPAVLSAPRLGCLNLHASLLPRLRGAAPIQWAILTGERETGISLMQMAEGLDVGPVYLSRKLMISEDETAGSLAEKLAHLGAELIHRDLPGVLEGGLLPTPQDERLATWAPPITREHLELDWTWPAARITAWVRGLSPRPGAQTHWRGKLLRIGHALPVEDGPAGRPGTVRVSGRRIWVCCGAGAVELLHAQLEGRKMLSAGDLINGRVLQDGEQLGPGLP